MDWYLKNTLLDAIYTVTGEQDIKRKRQLTADIKKLLPKELAMQMIAQFDANYYFFDKTKPQRRIKYNRRYYRKYPNAQEMNGVAWNIYDKEDELIMLQFALELCEKSLAINYDPFTLDTKAHILYKLQQKEAALAVQKEAVAIAKEKYPDSNNAFLEFMQEIEASIP